MRALTILLTAMFVLGAFAAPLWADTVTLEPTDDMYSDPEHPGTPPTETELWVANYSGAGHYERIMMRFDLDALPPFIDDATLHLYRFFRCPSHYYTATRFFAISENWNEETWPYTQHISHEASPFTSHTFGPDLGWCKVDITDQVRSWLSGGTENHGFVIEGLTGEKWSKFYSKEHTNPGQRPYMTVDYSCVGVDGVNATEMATPFDLRVSNPFRTNATIQFSLPESERITVEVFDIRGRLVARPVEGERNAGNHAANWEGRNMNGEQLPAGMYFCRLQAGNRQRTEKIILLR